MPNPISFTSASPKHGLPLLFPGQSQKEFFVNQAHSLIDALLHPAVEGEMSDPPADPAEGQCWLVGPAPTALWEGREGHLACWSAGDWLFAAPRNGMRLLDLASGQMRLHRAGEWTWANAPAVPSGGAIVDSEARSAISEILAVLEDSGILPG